MIASMVVYHEITDDDPLRDRQFRTKLFYELREEMNGLELPANSAISGTEANHKASLILITRRYRSEADRDAFRDSIHQSLVNRGWIAYRGEDERVAIRTYRYCRDGYRATLYLDRKGIFNSDSADEWSLSFSAGLGPGPSMLDSDPRLERCFKK
jgi:hypothetical protein